MAEHLSTAKDGDRDFIQSLAKGLAVIEAFSSERPFMTLSEAARVTGLSRAAARRVLHTLEQLGYCRCDGRQFHLRPRVLNLGFAYLHGTGLSSVAQPFMVELVNQVHESCSIGVLDGTEVVYVARVPTQQRIMTINLSIGSRLPAHLTSMGRVLLAGLPQEQRERVLGAIGPIERKTASTITDHRQLSKELARVEHQHFAILDQELEPGLRSVAVPIRDSTGRTVAALNIGTHASRHSLQALKDHLLPVLGRCAENISQALGAPQRG